MRLNSAASEGRGIVLRTSAALVVGLGFAVGVVPANAGPQPPNNIANGRRCSFASEYDPRFEGDTQSGTMNGGPLVAVSPGATIELICTIQTGGANSTHAGTDSVTTTSGPMLQVAAFAADEVFQYIAAPNQPVFMCSQAIIAGTTYYWDATVATPGPVSQLDTAVGWTTNSGATCNEAISQETYPRGGTCPANAVIHFSCYYTDATGTHFCVVWIGDPPNLLDSDGLCPTSESLPDLGPLPASAGRRCSFTSAGSQRLTGEITGGPIGHPSGSNAPTTLRCSIQTGAGSSTHAGTDSVAKTTSGTGSATLPPTLFDFDWPEGDPVHLCTEVTVGATTYYWNADDSTWSTSSTAGCQSAFDLHIAGTPSAADSPGNGVWVVCAGTTDTTACV
jgi:hypothetical protein